MWCFNPLWLWDVLTSQNFIATVLGVFSAFFLDRTWTHWQNHSTRKNLKEDLRKELEDCVNRLREHDVKRIETETLYVWQLSVHSGNAAFLWPCERKEIGQKYFALDNYNYEAELVRAFGEDYRQAKGQSDEKPKWDLWGERSKEIANMQDKLADNIAEFLKKECFWRTRLLDLRRFAC
jgi:hypothetical protein